MIQLIAMALFTKMKTVFVRHEYRKNVHTDEQFEPCQRMIKAASLFIQQDVKYTPLIEVLARSIPSFPVAEHSVVSVSEDPIRVTERWISPELALGSAGRYGLLPLWTRIERSGDVEQMRIAECR